MSRIIVKNLPNKISEEDVCTFFAKSGPITDVKLIYKDGEFRGYGFIGFENAETGADCVRYYNKAFFKQNKLVVELCSEFGEKSSPEKRANKAKAEQPPPDKNKDNDSFDHTTKVKKRNIAHPFIVVIRTQEICKQADKKCFTSKSIKSFIGPIECKRVKIPPKVKYVAYVYLNGEKDVKAVLRKDKSFIDGARVHITRYKSSDTKEAYSQAEVPWKAAEEKLKAAENVAESGKVYVRNLWYSMTEDDIRERFEDIGPVTEINMPLCKTTRRNKGFADVTFLFPEHALAALNELDGKTLKGRLLHVLPYRENEEVKDKTTSEKSFKEKRLQEKKSTSTSWHNWNTLFLSSEAVVDIMAKRYGKSKQQILNSEGKQSTAVNLALGETQIVDETKRFLENEGISIKAFEEADCQRSKSVILVKNLPAETTATDLRELFEKYGQVGRVVMPPAGVTAIVEMLNPGEAKLAFRSLAYSKFRYSPLYLEYAPVNTFAKEYQCTTMHKNHPWARESHQKDNFDPHPMQNESDPMKDNSSPELQPEPESTVYVKNLNFETKEDQIREHFSRAGPVCSVLIAKKRALSLGYGFVQFYRKSDAKQALCDLQDTLIDNHRISIKMSQKTLVETNPLKRKFVGQSAPESTKILVKNIPFQASVKEIKQLFVTFGVVKSVRLPEKQDRSSHRGFGFVDFGDKADAKKAFDALRLSTHLYGRRLVLEWAADDQNVEAIREKTTKQFLASGPVTKKTKFEVKEKVEMADND